MVEEHGMCFMSGLMQWSMISEGGGPDSAYVMHALRGSGDCDLHTVTSTKHRFISSSQAPPISALPAHLPIAASGLVRLSSS